MKRKTYDLIVGIAGGVTAIAVAVVTFVNPDYATAINASIAIADTAICEICSKFVKD